MNEAQTRLKAKFGARIIGFVDNPYTVNTTDNFSADEEKQVRDIIAKRALLDSWEASKLRNLTLDQLNNEITTRQAEINAVTNLTQAKTAMLNLLTDEAKAWRIILWLLKREQEELELPET